MENDQLVQGRNINFIVYRKEVKKLLRREWENNVLR
jgi:hypothetical protein